MVCYAASSADYRVSDKALDTRFSDVGERFRKCFLLFFCLCCFQIVMFIFISLNVLSKPLTVMTILASYAYALIWIYLIIMRFSHSGKICSGDFLKEDEPTDGYLIEQGMFIRGVFYFFIYAFVIGGCIACWAGLYAVS